MWLPEVRQVEFNVAEHLKFEDSIKEETKAFKEQQTRISAQVAVECVTSFLFTTGSMGIVDTESHIQGGAAVPGIPRRKGRRRESTRRQGVQGYVCCTCPSRLRSATLHT
jgi:hypothetical protein